MDETITAAEANRRFSKILRRVREGHSVIVTSHGRPVARIIPAAGGESARDQVWKDHLQRLRARPAIDVGHWTRDELYDDEPT